MTHELALTLPHWRECLRPIAARLAQTFRESLVNKGGAPRTVSAKSGNKRRSIPGTERSPLLATPRKASQPRPYATRAWRAPTVEARLSNPTACAMCGEPVLKRRRRHCEACMPKARREHGLRAIEAARTALAAQTAAGNDPRASAQPGASAVKRMRSSIAAITAGRASIRTSATMRGSSARSRRSSMRSRSRRSARRRALARGVLADTGRCEGATSAALGSFAEARELINVCHARFAGGSAERSYPLVRSAFWEASHLHNLARRALTTGAIVSFAGCGGLQQIAQTASPQLQGDAVSSPLPGGMVSQPAPWPLAHYPQTSQPLLYVGIDNPSAIDIFPLTGPNQRQVGSITNGIDAPWGLSVDSNKSLYVANSGNHTVTVYPYGSATPSMTYSILGAALYALADSAGHVFLSGWNKHHQGHVIEFNAGRNRVIAHQRLGFETDGMAEDGQGNLYVAYRGKHSGSIAEFGPGLTTNGIWA